MEGGLRRASPLRIFVLCGLLPLMPPIPRAPPVARERVRPPAPDGPPWKLISPYGVRHVIEDRAAIKTFCSDNELDLYNVNHLLGLYQGNSEQPQHVNFWQPQHLFLFLQKHAGDGELVGVLGGPGRGARVGDGGVDWFIDTVAQHRDDMPFTASNRAKLQRLLTGAYTSNSKPSNNYKGWGLAFTNTNGYAPSEFLDSWFATTQYWATEQAMLCP